MSSGESVIIVTELFSIKCTAFEIIYIMHVIPLVVNIYLDVCVGYVRTYTYNILRCDHEHSHPSLGKHNHVITLKIKDHRHNTPIKNCYNFQCAACIVRNSEPIA